MKLSQIYANKPFKKIQFNDGFNVILGKVSNPKDKDKDSHNLGKTTLISVIDFMLLKQMGKSHIFQRHIKKFSEYTFFLEIELNGGAYLTIKRSVGNNTKISFKKHSERHKDFTNEGRWDEEELPFKKAKTYLNNALAFDVLKDWDYRKSVTYFLRSQSDFRDVFQLEKFTAGKDVDWKPFMFDLLGFDGTILKEKYEVEQNKTKQKELIEEFKKQFSIDAEEMDKIRGAIELKNDELREVSEKIDDFNFYHQERGLNKELVERIENEISNLNTVEYNLGYEIERIRESFKNEFEFNIDDVKQVYEEARIFFSETLVKSYKELEEFNKKITEERNKYLQERLALLDEELRNTRNMLENLNKQRAEVLSFLQDRDSFSKFKSYQRQLAEIESEIARLEEKLNSINKIGELNKSVEKMDEDIKHITDKITEQINAQNQLYSKIRKSFRDIIREIIGSPAIIYIRPNSVGNVEYAAEIQEKNEIEITSAGKGTSYRKLLCMAFDLSILINYSPHSFYRFVYHDGALEALDDRPKIKFIDLVRNICNRHSIQYIFTSIEHDLPVSDQGKRIEFPKSEIALELDDSGVKGKLFEMSF